MSYIDALVDSYQRFVSLPWQQNIAPAQRVWMAIYPPEQERRARLHLRRFEIVTKEAGFDWKLIDITMSFERWMAVHEYREAYFNSPELLEPTLPDFFRHLCGEVQTQLTADDVSGQTVVGVVGAGSLFGLGPPVRTSALLNEVCTSIRGRLLVFFPGHYEGNNYRLLDAKDGPNYLATPITGEGTVL
jgi:hypothetical protein